MSKYIIKNCPTIVISNFNTHLPYCVDDVSNSNCQDRTDRVMKQIVRYCLDQNLKYDTTACDILDIIDIQEVE